MKIPNVPNTSVKLMLFPFSLEGAARIWLEKEPPRSIETWDDLVSKFINKFFPPSKTTNLRNEITRFQQKFDETFYEAWDRFNDLLRGCPHHGFSELHQLDTFYNALNSNDQDSLNSAAGGNFLDKMPRECLKIIESKSKVRQSRNKAVVAKMSTSSSTQAVSSDVAELKDMVRALILDRKNQTPASAPVKAVEQSCVTCGGEVLLIKKLSALTETVHMKLSEYVSQAAAANFNQANSGYRPRWSKSISTSWSDLSTSGSSTVVNQQLAHQGTAPQNTVKTAISKWQILNDNASKFVTANTALLPVLELSCDKGHDAPAITKHEDVQPPVVQIQSRNPNPEPNVAPVIPPVPKASIPFPSRRNDERRKEKANDQIEKFYEIFRDLSFEISFTDALMLMPKFASTLKTLIGNKEKLSELARTPLNENCSAVILNKLPKKLGDPGRFLIPCEFTGITTCNALADLGASINLMPYSVWNNLSLPELTPTCMTLELADRSITKPIGIAEDVFVNVGKFQFPADFVVVDFEPDPRVPLILGRCFLKTSHALIDVYEGEITLRVGKEAITFNLDQTSKYTADYNHMTVNKIDVIDMACDEYSQEVLGFSNVIASGNPTPYSEPIVSTASPTLTPFGDSDFLLFEEADSFLALEDDPTSSEVDPTYQDPEGDILLLEAILNSEPPLPLPNHEQYMPEVRKELKLCEAKTVESSVNEPPEVELKELPPHLEYAFLEGDDKLPVIIAKDLKDEEKAALLKVLKSHKRAIAWKLSDIKGVSPEFCTHKILMEEDYEPSVQSQRRPFVSPVHCEPTLKEVIKLNEATRKDHFPLPFMDQMLERLAGNEYYCFLDGFSGYFQIPIDPKDQEKTTFTCPYGTFAYRRMPFGLCNAPGTFQRCMMAIFQRYGLRRKRWKFSWMTFLFFGDSFSIANPFGKDVDARLRNWGSPRAKKNQALPTYHTYASKTMNEAQTHYTTTKKELLAVVYAFEKFRSYLVMSKSIVYTDHSAIKYLFAKKDAKARLMRWILLLHGNLILKFENKKELENSTPIYVSRLKIDKKNSRTYEINEAFIRGTLVLLLLQDQRPHGDKSFVLGKKGFRNSQSLATDSIGPPLYMDANDFDHPLWTIVNVKEKLRNVMRCHKTSIKFAKSLTYWGIDFMGPFPSSDGNKTYSLGRVWLTYLSKAWVEAKALPNMDARVVS
ncbi:reverse transcriptase domain-containing protein [Tanacetum coccineum]